MEVVYCSRCVLSNIDVHDIEFDENGVCNYCRAYDKNSSGILFNEDLKEKKLEEIVKRIKAEGIGRPYDCVLGISGGVDSSYLAFMASKLDLRILVVHYDNGWNSGLAVKNIENIVNKLNLDLYTYVNDWYEYRDLQLAFLKASVIDIELITDHAIVAALYLVARRYKIKNILFGDNHATESILPPSWYHWKNDLLNIRAIHRKFGTIPLKTYPVINFYNRLLIDYFRNTNFISLLNYMDYDKEKAKKTMIEEVGWSDYGGKHFESIFTRFYQGYILPVKFGVDKRKAHFSSLILAGQMTRAEALEELKTNPYTPEQAREDKEYVIKKFGLTAEEFENIMKLPVKSHYDYPSYITKHYKYMAYLGSIKRKLSLTKR